MSYGGGYNAACYKSDSPATGRSQAFYSVAYSVDVAAYVKQNPTFKVGINGYADARGTDQHNQALSERRVNAIRDALVKAGVTNDKIQSAAFGE